MSVEYLPASQRHKLITGVLEYSANTNTHKGITVCNKISCTVSSYFTSYGTLFNGEHQVVKVFVFFFYILN